MTTMVGRFSQLIRLYRRRREAARWGIPFRRVRDFVLPASAVLGEDTVPLSFPPRAEVVTALVALLLDDEYGLASIPAGASARTILDIGGNVGLFTLAARRRFPEAAIHCYEPNLLLEPHLRTQASSARALCHFEAVGAVDGEVSFFSTSDSMTGTVDPVAGDDGGPAPARPVTVPQVSLSRALDRLAGPGNPVDIVKMDCEGAEWAMLADPAPLSRIGRLLLEFHPRPGRGAGALPGLLAAGGLRIEKQIATAGGCGVIWAVRDREGGGHGGDGGARA